MAGGFCLRAPAQGACTYANICVHCPSYRAEPSSLPILAAQRVDAEALARDAELGIRSFRGGDSHLDNALPSR